MDTLELTEDMLVSSDIDMRELAAAVLIPPPLPPIPGMGPPIVKPVFPDPKPVVPYVPRELRILTVSTGGYALVVGQTTILAVAEAEGRLLSQVSSWARG